MSTTIQLNLVDRSAERTSVRIPIVDLAAGSIAVIEAFETELEEAIGGLSLLAQAGTSVNEVTRSAYTLPTDQNAVRELAVRFVMADEDMNQASFSVGGPNLALFPFTVGEGGDIYQWNSGTPSATLGDFVASVEIIARHPISGAQMTMQRLELVGRNN